MSSTPTIGTIATRISQLHGLAVFPVWPSGPRKKKPMLKGYRSAGTTDRSGDKLHPASKEPAEIKRQFARALEMTGGEAPLVGAVMDMSGLVAIDYDAYKGEHAAKQWVEDHHAELEETRLHATPGGGFHFIFVVPKGWADMIPTGAALGGLDFKYKGYVIWPSPDSGYRVVRDVAPKDVDSAIVDAMRQAVWDTRRMHGGKGGGSGIFSDVDAALDALKKDQHRHDAILYLAQHVVMKTGATAGSLDLVMDNVLALIAPMKRFVDPERWKVLTDTSEGGELRGACDWAIRRVGRVFSNEDMPKIRERMRRLGLKVGGRVEIVTAPSIEEKAAAVASVRSLEDDLPSAPDSDVDPKTFSPVQWVYGSHMAKGYVSMTTAPGGVGKSTLVLTEALAMASGQPILGSEVFGGPKRVLYWNGEDPLEELQKRAWMAAHHHGVSHGGNLKIISGREHPLTLAILDGYAPQQVREVIEGLVEVLIAKEIDVLILDPLVSLHRLNENDNASMDLVMAALREVAERANVAIEVVHHSVKVAMEAQSRAVVQEGQARGASSITYASRSVRALASMTLEEAKDGGVTLDDRGMYVKINDLKSNLAARLMTPTWFRKVSRELGNGTAEYPRGDLVPAIERWTMPKIEALISDIANWDAVLKALKEADGLTGRRFDPQSQGWLGWAVARNAEIDAGEGHTNAALKRMAKTSDVAVEQLRNREALIRYLDQLVDRGSLQKDSVRDSQRGRIIWYYRLPTETALEGV